MRSELLSAAVVVLGLGSTPTATANRSPSASGDFLPADPSHRWSFPADWRAHPGYRDEWWYFTGTLGADGDPSRRLGFQITFFRIGLAPRAPALDSAWATADAVMVHLAVTDIAAGTHRFSEVLWRAVPLLGGFPSAPDAVLAWARAPPGTDGRWEARLEGERFRLAAGDAAQGLSLDLWLQPAKPPALQGPNGLSRKAEAEGFASLYASITRLEAEGTVEVGGRPLAVHGEAWMDREIGSSQLAPDQAGWDWWGLRLRDGRDLMLYVLRRKDGSISWRNGTLVDRAGRVRLLSAEDWSVRPTGSWRSDASGATYPSGWEVSLPGEGIRLSVSPEVRAAENRSALVPGLHYWEGPVVAASPDGAPAGEGYVELTGYGERSRPPL
jgi:predicted secreted hydrolase